MHLFHMQLRIGQVLTELGDTCSHHALVSLGAAHLPLGVLDFDLHVGQHARDLLLHAWEQTGDVGRCMNAWEQMVAEGHRRAWMRGGM